MSDEYLNEVVFITHHSSFIIPFLLVRGGVLLLRGHDLRGGVRCVAGRGRRLRGGRGGHLRRRRSGLLGFARRLRLGGRRLILGTGSVRRDDLDDRVVVREQV